MGMVVIQPYVSVSKLKKSKTKFLRCTGYQNSIKPYKARFIAYSSSRVKALLPGRVAQWVTCVATDASLTADPGVPSLIPVLSHTFVEIDHEIISTVILLPSAESFKNGCCQLQAKVCA